MNRSAYLGNLNLSTCKQARIVYRVGWSEGIQHQLGV
jgi:hypothetical protein